MKVKVSEASSPVLDWMVAKCEDLHTGIDGFWTTSVLEEDDYFFRYSTNWEFGGPIIEREGIDVFCNVPTNPQHPDPAWRGSWKACYHRMGFGTAPSYGPTPLIAAMRAYVASKLGDEVEAPDEFGSN